MINLLHQLASQMIEIAALLITEGQQRYIKGKKSLHAALGLIIVQAPPLRDCLIQSCILLMRNRFGLLTKKETKELTVMKHSLSNQIANGKILEPYSNKHKKQRNHTIGWNLSSSMCANASNRDITSCMLNKKILVVIPCSRKIVLQMWHALFTFHFIAAKQEQNDIGLLQQKKI